MNLPRRLGVIVRLCMRGTGVIVYLYEDEPLFVNVFALCF